MLRCRIDRNEKCAVIKYINLKGLSTAEISAELKSVLGDSAPSDATIYRRRWIAEFQHGRKSTDDESRIYYESERDSGPRYTNYRPNLGL